MLTRCVFGGLFVALLVSAGTDTRLADAAMQGDVERVRSLLEQKVDVNGAQGDGSTALHWAATQDDLDVARRLIRAGANVKAATRITGVTPLFIACRNGSAMMIDILVKAGADPNAADSNGTTPLMIAAASGSPDAVKLLLQHGAEVNAREKAHSQTALMFAAALNRASVIPVLLAHGADAKLTTDVVKPKQLRVNADGMPVPDEEQPEGKQPDGKQPEGKSGAKPAGKVAKAAPPEVAELKEEVRKLTERLNELEKKQKPDKSSEHIKTADSSPEPSKNGNTKGSTKDTKGNTKKEDRAEAQNEEEKRKLRKRGAEVMGGMTALLFAARDGKMEAARALVEGGADINDAGQGEKMTPLVMAISNGHFDLAKMLLENGANPRIANIEGLTVLYATVDVQWSPHAWFPEPIIGQEQTGYLELMKALVAHGADPNAKLEKKAWFRTTSHDASWVDPAGATAFWRAAQANDVAAMRLLLEAGADPKIPSKDGVTPLMVAAGLGWAANFSVNATDAVLDSVKFCLDAGDDINAADTKGNTALHGAAFIGDNQLVQYLVDKGAKVDVKTKAGDTVADMANGPTRFGIPHPDTVALLEKLGSANSHNCRSDQCLVAPKEDKKKEGKPSEEKPATVTAATKPGQ